MEQTAGIHHITAIAGDPQENLDFYAGVLGMRLVKRSINQDVPDTYHLFFADGAGHPGTDLTFFPWPKLAPVRRGTGLWDEVSLAVPAGSLGYWRDRLEAHGAEAGAGEERFGEPVLPFSDPHGMRLALVESETYEGLDFAANRQTGVPAEHQIRALAGIRLTVRELAPTARFLERTLGFEAAGKEDGWQRYRVGAGRAGQRVDIMAAPDGSRGRWGVGAVHHVAWRAPDEEEQLERRTAIASAGGHPTPVIDRFWFKSVYVNEPGGALLEVATDGPGFTTDEDLEHLGESLVLPPRFEDARSQIERALPPLTLPGRVTQGRSR